MKKKKQTKHRIMKQQKKIVDSLLIFYCYMNT